MTICYSDPRYTLADAFEHVNVEESEQCPIRVIVQFSDTFQKIIKSGRKCHETEQYRLQNPNIGIEVTFHEMLILFLTYMLINHYNMY